MFIRLLRFSFAASLIAVSFLVIRTAHAAGTTYYVSPSGNNEYAGTSPTAPWRTINKVNLSTFSAGDSILFEGGQTFSGGLRFSAANAQSSVEHPITIGSYGSGDAIINSQAVEGFIATNVGNITLRDLTFTGAGSTSSTVSGVVFTNTLSGDVKLSNIIIKNIDVSGYGETGIKIRGATGASGYDGVSITDNVVHDNAGGSTGGGNGTAGIYITGANYGSGITNPNFKNVTISRNKVFNNLGVNTNLNWTGSGIVVAQTDGATVSYNKVYENGAGSDGCSCGPVGIWAFDATRVTIEFNESHHNRRGGSIDGGGFDFDGGVTNSIIQYNYSHDNAGAGYMLYAYNDGSVTQWGNNIVRYNVSQNDERGIYIPSGSQRLNVYVVHNTFYGSSSSTVLLALSEGTGSGSTGLIANNIFYGVNDTVLAETVTSSISVLGNNYFAQGTSTFIHDSQPYTSLAAWQAASGHEWETGVSTALFADPRLYSPGTAPTTEGYDSSVVVASYGLPSNSPVVDRARNLSSMNINLGTVDFTGAGNLSGDNRDIGAFEYQYPRTSSRSSGRSSNRRAAKSIVMAPPVVSTSPSTSSSAVESTTFPFMRDLTIGSFGDDVLALQRYLNAAGFTLALSGPGSVGSETRLFGALTRAALIRFQQANNVTPAIGYFGPLTRAALLTLW